MKQHNLTLIASFALIFSSAPVTGQSIYRWTDAQGKVHFSNAPVSEAKAVDDELPPATSFGGMQDSAVPFQPPPSAEQQSDSPRSTTALSPDNEGNVERDEKPVTTEESTTNASEPIATREETAKPESEEPSAEENTVEFRPQLTVDFSEREESQTQTTDSENDPLFLLDEDSAQPDLDPQDTDEEDSDDLDDSGDYDDSNDDDDPGNEDETEEDSEQDS